MSASAGPPRRSGTPEACQEWFSTSRAASRCSSCRGSRSASRQAEDTFLPPKEAYKYTVEATQGDVVVRIDIQPGYYLYRDRLGLESATPGVTIGVPDFPVGEDHEDQYFGKQVIYRGDDRSGREARVRRPAATLRPDPEAPGLRRRGALLPAPAMDEPRRRGSGRRGRALR